MTDRKKPSQAKLEKAMNAAFKRFASRKYVTGIDIGYKWEGGKPTKTVCVRVHVNEKMPDQALEAAVIFPKEIDGIALDIIQAEYKPTAARVHPDRKKPFPVLMGGISIGHRRVSAGALGGFVVDNVTGRPAILSNWHVLAGPKGEPGDAVLHPGPEDEGVYPFDTVAALGRSILNMNGDAAVAHLKDGAPWTPFMYGNGLLPNNPRNSRLGETLEKSGRSTALTKAKVDGEGIYKIPYITGSGSEELKHIRGFKLVSVKAGNPDDIEISSCGDSGSFWLDPGSGSAVGLHFAGEVSSDPAAEQALACNITSVLDELDVRLATVEDWQGAGDHAMKLHARSAQIEALQATPGLSWSSGRLDTGLSIGPGWPGYPQPWPNWPMGQRWPYPWAQLAAYCPNCRYNLHSNHNQDQ